MFSVFLGEREGELALNGNTQNTKSVFTQVQDLSKCASTTARGE